MAKYQSYDDFIMDRQMKNEVNVQPIILKKRKKVKQEPSSPRQDRKYSYMQNELKAAKKVILLCEQAFLTNFSDMENGDRLEDEANKALYRALQEWSEIN